MSTQQPDRQQPTRELDPRQREIADGVITSLAGPDARLRADQETAVAALASPGARVLVVQATGWGKSAVYWAATAVIRAAGGGPTLIVSPLLSLMRDQVAAATRGGLRAATVNSANIDDWSAVEHDLLDGTLDVLLVSPERLANPGFGRRVLDALAGRLGLVVIDEAHAISDWGHDFRPDYRRVSDVLQTLNPQTSVLATTATANERVTADVAAQLGDATLVLRGPLARKSLHLNVIDGLDPLERYAWVAQELPMLPGSGIVYVLTVADADRLVQAVRAVHGDELPVAAYTGGLPADERHRLEDELLAGRVKALIATSALGMGFDKPDLGFVVHVGAPPSPVSYYQQVGRAGRALDEAVVMLLASKLDDAIWEHFATATIPDPARMDRLLEALANADGPMTVPGLESATGIRRGRVELMCKQLAVDGAVERTSDGWLVTGKPWTYDAPHYEGVLAVRRREADIMRSFIRGEKCLMRLLTESLDDPRSQDCGQCSVCRGEITPGLAEAPEVEVVRTVGGVLRRDAETLEPRKMWPGGAFGTRGRIPPAAMAEPGRILAFADAPQWRDVLDAAKAGDAVADQLADAAVNVVARWGRESGVRPDLIFSLDLTGRGLAATLAQKLREVGRRDGDALPVQPGQRPGREETGATEAAYWRDHLGPMPQVSGNVLVVVDETSSGWPVTLAAAQLREAGATAVLPLVIHRTA
ncbi:DEAD/DEAH box helicase [Gordonia sp. (in: high G+C Gram-positive bacteria)]|uniref:RecQ family ATP-dependent DNA helicase n=1 Tax=Gordonia sp. (in: high G+C Gram-positive bacteria) TaxID=84139 RepID=UPI001693ECEF|nr:DEAD/DEAH box helicase [Gordonia sp. (in: high G+C Gram-positive bacteria)]NLG45016.1 DEAD/DEAH box helicase [Gordonia sp. (in: high G+C Gram-positive bacteria)]